MESSSLTLPAAGRAHWVKTAAYYLGFIILGMSSAIIGPTLSALAAQTETHLNEISLIFPLMSFGYLLGSLLGGRIYDKHAGHPILAALLLGMAGTLALAPLMPHVLLLGAVLLPLGVAQGAFDVGTNALIVWIYRRAVGPYMNGLHFCFGLGATLSPLVVAQMLGLTGETRGAYWGVALLALPAAFFVSRLPSPARLVQTEAEAVGRNDTLLVLLFAAFLFFYVGAEHSMGSWLPTYAATTILGDVSAAAYLTSTFWGVFTLGRLLAVPLALRIRPRWLLLSDLLICLTGVFLIIGLPHSAVALWSGVILLGLGMASVFPTTFALAERRLTLDGRTTSRIFIGVATGGMVLPWIIGQLFEATGPQATMFVILTALLIEVVLFGVLMARSRVRKKE